MKQIQESLKKIILFIMVLMILTSSMIILQKRGYTFFVLFQCIFVFLCFLYNKKVYIFRNPFVNLTFIELIISAGFAYFSDMKSTYCHTAVYMTMLLIPIYLATSYINHMASEKQRILNVIRKTMKIAVLMQMGWCMLQFVLNRLLKWDLNKIIFTNFLHMVKTASIRREGTLSLTGFGWHPVLMAPILVIAYYMFDSKLVKLMAIIIAFLCGNSTAIIGVVMCLGFDILKMIPKIKEKVIIRRDFTFIIICVSLIGVGVLIQTGMLEVIWTKIQMLFQRILIAESDDSAIAHKRYFTAYPNVLSISSLIQVLLGYGEGCSGYPFGVLFQQYVGLTNWSVESDVMNILISRGLLGFCAFYGFLGTIMWKGKAVNLKYTSIILIFIVQGITYNIQFDWLFMFEIILLISIENKFDIFCGLKEKIK